MIIWPKEIVVFIVQLLSHVRLFATLRTAACQASLSFLHYLLEFAQILVHWVGDAIQPSHPLLPFSPFVFSLSQHHIFFQWVSSLHQGGQSIGASASASVFSINIQGWFPLGLTGLISCSSRNSQERGYSIQRHQLFGAQSFFMAQLSHLYITTGKPITLTIRTSVSKVMSLPFNTLSRFVTVFLPRQILYWLSYKGSPYQCKFPLKRILCPGLELFLSILVLLAFSSKKHNLAWLFCTIQDRVAMKPKLLLSRSILNSCC